MSKSPLAEKYPIPPAYTFLFVFSNSSIISIALIFGAPDTVPAGKPDRRVSNFENFLLNLPITFPKEKPIWGEKKIRDFNQLINEESSIDSKFVIFLATFLNEASSIEIKNISSYWGIEKNIQKQWDELSKANYELNMFDADNGSNSKLNQILINCNLQICISLSQHLNPILSKRIYEYWNTLKNLKPHLTSSELIHMGICEGPLLGKAIQELNNQVIDKKLKTKKDEIEFVKKFTNLD